MNPKHFDLGCLITFELNDGKKLSANHLIILFIKTGQNKFCKGL